MNEITIRSALADETDGLRSLWAQAFGTEGEAAFFNLLYSPEHTITAMYDGILAAMGYIIACGDLTTGAASRPCAMLYSIATAPQFRGRGLGAAVVDALISRAHDSGFSSCVLYPAQESLFGYYTSRSALREWFYADVKAVVSDMPDNRGQAGCGALPTVQDVETDEYVKIRESLLKDSIHIIYNVKTVEYQRQLCIESGGGLCRIGGSCAAAERSHDGSVMLKELLVSDNDDKCSIIRALSNKFNTEGREISYRSPAKHGHGKRFAMADISTFDNTGSSFLPWYGFAFD